MVAVDSSRIDLRNECNQPRSLVPLSRERALQTEDQLAVLDVRCHVRSWQSPSSKFDITRCFSSSYEGVRRAQMGSDTARNLRSVSSASQHGVSACTARFSGRPRRRRGTAQKTVKHIVVYVSTLSDSVPPYLLSESVLFRAICLFRRRSHASRLRGPPTAVVGGIDRTCAIFSPAKYTL